MAKKLKKPSVSLTRDGYKFILSFGNIDSNADNIHIEKEVYEKKDSEKSSDKAREYKKYDKKASIQSWSYELDKNKYYPFVKDGQSDLAQRIDKVIFRVWVTGKVNKKTRKSNKTTVTYEFNKAVKPSVTLVYDENGTTFTYGVDINDDFTIDTTKKSVVTRAWVWVTSRRKGDAEDTKVSGHGGRWYNKDDIRNIREAISTNISPDVPIKFTAHAYSAGPGGKSDEVTESRVFAKPLVPAAPNVTVLKPANSNGFYNVDWVIDTQDGWRPVDNVTIQYADVTTISDSISSWSVAKDNIHSSVKRIQTDDLGPVSDDSIRYFRILATRDGASVPSYMTDIVAYGIPSNVTGVTAEAKTITGSDGKNKPVLDFKWTNTVNQIYHANDNRKKLRLNIYANKVGALDQNGNGLIKTIRYGDPEWNAQQWIYENPGRHGSTVDFIFRVNVGQDDLNPGAQSELLYLHGVAIPQKITNLKAQKLANNTAVHLSWDNPIDKDTLQNGVEIAWSTFPNAWESNQPPSTMTFENGIMDEAYVVGLSAGEVYYFWARLFDESDSGTSYGIWSDPTPGLLLSDKPNSPVLTTSRSWVKEGGNLTAQWLYSATGNLPQTFAQVEISSDKSNWNTIANVVGEDDKCTVDLSKKVNGKYLYGVGKYYLRVLVKNSMGNAVSEPTELIIAAKPTSSLSSSSIVNYTYTAEVGATVSTESITAKTLRKLPLTVNVSGNGDLNLYVYCIENFEWEHPDRTDRIFTGDCIWTSQIQAGSYTIDNISLADNCKYRIQLECTNPETLLKADSKWIDFEVHWEHQAVAPVDSTVSIDEDGVATLVPVKPSGATNDDVCDIYRYTADRRYLCRENVRWGQTVTDEYPTYGDPNYTYYTFCTRTPDGDESWTEVEYVLDGAGVKLNYGSELIDLPYNVSIDDGRTKQGEIRTHLGGSKLFFGQANIDRKQSISTQLIMDEDREKVEQLYELSRHNELCYVRTSYGVGYCANVDVTIKHEYNKQTINVSINAVEADANGEYLGVIMEEES